MPEPMVGGVYCDDAGRTLAVDSVGADPLGRDIVGRVATPNPSGSPDIARYATDFETFDKIWRIA